MLHLLLLLPLVFGAYERQGTFRTTKGKIVGQYDINDCFEAEFDITVKGKQGPWCNIMVLGENSYRKLGIWLYPGQTRLHVRTRTTNHGNPGGDPNVQLAINKKTNVRINACKKSLIVTLGTKSYSYTLPGPLVGGGKRNLYLSDKNYVACNAELGDVEVFESLAPVYSDCAKLKTLYQSKKSKLEGEQKAAENAIGVHQAAQKSGSSLMGQLKTVEKRANELKAVSKKTVDKLLALLKKLMGECNGEIAKAKQAETDAKGKVAQCKQQLKHLDVNKVSCDCAKLKTEHGAKIGAKDTENGDLAKEKKRYEDQLKMLRPMLTNLKNAAKAQKNDFLGQMMAKMYNDQAVIVQATISALEAEMKKFDVKIAANTVYINKYKKEIADCDKKLEAMKSKLMELFTEEDEDILQMVEEMEYFENLRAAEVWSDNLDMDVYEREFNVQAEEEETTFAAEQEVEGVTTQVDYGLIGGSIWLASGLFYYAYQRKST